jgi:hypothetical protein
VDEVEESDVDFDAFSTLSAEETKISWITFVLKEMLLSLLEAIIVGDKGFAALGAINESFVVMLEELTWVCMLGTDWNFLELLSLLSFDVKLILLLRFELEEEIIWGNESEDLKCFNDLKEVIDFFGFTVEFSVSVVVLEKEGIWLGREREGELVEVGDTDNNVDLDFGILLLSNFVESESSSL